MHKLSMFLIGCLLQGCSVASTYTGFIFGGEDLANATKRVCGGGAGSILAVPAFIGGTIAGPFVGLFWGLRGDFYILSNIDSLFSPYPHLDIHADSFTLVQRPFSGPSRIENDLFSESKNGN